MALEDDLEHQHRHGGHRRGRLQVIALMLVQPAEMISLMKPSSFHPVIATIAHSATLGVRNQSMEGCCSVFKIPA